MAAPAAADAMVAGSYGCLAKNMNFCLKVSGSMPGCGSETVRKFGSTPKMRWPSASSEVVEGVCAGTTNVPRAARAANLTHSNRNLNHPPTPHPKALIVILWTGQEGPKVQFRL